MTIETVKSFTLCFLHDDEQVLLGMKKQGFGEGKWNGFGGKVEPGETIEAAAIRELEEEAGLRAHAVEKRAEFDFRSAANSLVLQVHVYAVLEHSGEPQETGEMRPQWFRHKDIPFDAMWKDDIHWLPRFLAGEQLRGSFLFDDLDDPDAELLEFTLESVA